MSQMIVPKKRMLAVVIQLCLEAHEVQWTYCHVNLWSWKNPEAYKCKTVFSSELERTQKKILKDFGSDVTWVHYIEPHWDQKDDYKEINLFLSTMHPGANMEVSNNV